MDEQNVLKQSHTNDNDSPSEVFAYASKLVENDLAAAVRIFRQAPKAKQLDTVGASRVVTA